MKRLQEVAAIPPGDKTILREVRALIAQLLPGATVYLYGSGARGTREPDSDLDLLIVTERPVTRSEETRAADAIYDLELARGVVLSLLWYARPELSQRLLCTGMTRATVRVESSVSGRTMELRISPPRQHRLTAGPAWLVTALRAPLNRFGNIRKQRPG